MRMVGAVLSIVFLSVDQTAATNVPPGHVAVGPLRFDAAVTLAAGKGIRTTVSIVNTGRDSTHLEIAADCPVTLRLYAPRSTAKAPAFDGTHRICFDMSRTIRLAPNKPVTFTRSDSIATILGDSLAAGDYAATAVVRFSGGRLEIPAGRISLRR